MSLVGFLPVHLQGFYELLKVRQLDLQRCIHICKLSENATQKSKVLRPEGVNRVIIKLRGNPSTQKKSMYKLCASQHELSRELSHIWANMFQVQWEEPLRCKMQIIEKKMFRESRHINVAEVVTAVVI